MADSEITVTIQQYNSRGDIVILEARVGAEHLTGLGYLQLDYVEFAVNTGGDRNSALTEYHAAKPAREVSGDFVSCKAYFPSEIDTIYHYWARAVDKSGNRGEWSPSSPLAGEVFSTGGNTRVLSASNIVSVPLHFNLGGSDPIIVSDGDVWPNSAGTELRIRLGGLTYKFVLSPA